MSDITTETFGPLGDAPHRIVGLTGKRGVGKSTVANLMVEAGFVRVHAFDGGKTATSAYFQHLGANADTAHRMVHGDLKDVPSPLLPGAATPRYFMEKFGSFMGRVMGSEWTLGAELDRVARQFPTAPVVVESVVYEEPLLRSRGGIVVRVVRPNHSGPAGMETDAAEAGIQADITIENGGSLDDLRRAVEALI